MIKYDICTSFKRKMSESQNQHFQNALQDVIEWYTTNDSLRNAGLDQIKQICLLQEFTEA